MAKTGRNKPRKINNRTHILKTNAGSPARSKTSFYVVCIGASAGGLNAVIELASQLPSQLNAAVFIVIHFSKTTVGEILADRIRRDVQLPCTIARHDEPINPGHIYIAAPDAHLLIKDRIILGYGAAENRFRPSIDVLFRSAAAYYDGYAIGIVLTGLLNDGTTGMWAIKQCGGHSIIQDPDEAEFPDMPLSVLQHVQVDYCARLQDIGAIIQKITQRKSKRVMPSPQVLAESAISEKAAIGVEKVVKLGEPSVYACPDCGGNLFKIKNGKLVHYRCYTGHSYSEEDLMLKQSENFEHAVWVAIRMMEERRLLFRRMEWESGGKGLRKLAENYKKQAAQLETHIAKMKDLLISSRSD